MADSDHQAERAPDAEGAARKMDGRQYDGEGPHRAGERAYGKTANYLRTLPLHHSQRVKDTTEAYTDFSYDIRPTPDFIGELLKYDRFILHPESKYVELKTLRLWMHYL